MPGVPLAAPRARSHTAPRSDRPGVVHTTGSLNDSGAVSGRERKNSQARAGLRPGGLGKGKTHACAFARAERLESLAVRPNRATPKQSPKRNAGRDAPHIGQDPELAPRDFVRRKTPAIRREAPPVAEDVSNRRRTGSFRPAAPRRLRVQNCRTCWQNQIGLTPRPLGFAACCLGCRKRSSTAAAIIPLRSNGRESEILASRSRDDARERVQTARPHLDGFAAELAWRNASGTITQHTLSVRSLVPRSHLNSSHADNSPCRDPSARN